MITIFEKKYKDGSKLTIRERVHPICETIVPAIDFSFGGGKGITAYLADVDGEDFAMQLVVALKQYLSDLAISDTEDAIDVVKVEGN